MWSIGLDVHLLTSSICILDENGKVVKEMKIPGRWPRLFNQLAKINHPFAICYEASCGYGHLYDRLAQIAKRVVVAHPGHLRLIFRSKRKNDRVDAKKLATLLLLDQVPVIHVPAIEVRDWRSLIEFRNRLVGKRTRAKNGIRALLRGHGIAMPVGKRLWTQKGLGWLERLQLPTSVTTLQRDLLLDELQALDAKVKRVEKELNAIGQTDRGVILLRTIPGVGPRTAEAVRAYIDHPARFTRNKKIGSYFGLVPSQDQSADRNRMGHITKQGPATVRRLLVEAAWQSIRRSEHVRAHFERIMDGDRERKKIALVATAHYLLRVMHSMLLSGESWRWGPEEAKVA